jgi:acyl-CoA thioester hydrolase
MDPSRAHRTPPHRTTVQLRYSDTDMMGHINNAAYAQFLEIARMEYLDQLLPPEAQGPTVMLARLELNYRREVKLGQLVEVLTQPTRAGTSSWTYAFQILADGVLCADGSSVQVYVDVQSRRPAPLPEVLRERLLAALPQEAAHG